MGQYLALRVRTVLYGKMLRQEIGWFDLEQNSSGKLNTLLSRCGSRGWEGFAGACSSCRRQLLAPQAAAAGKARTLARAHPSAPPTPKPPYTPSRSDASYVRGAVGDVVGLMLQNILCLAAGYVIAFIYEWRMALLVTGILPLLISSAIIHHKFITGHGSGADQK
jgi:ABC-type multidrug transport system fused ATPase/permease subunit